MTITHRSSRRSKTSRRPCPEYSTLASAVESDEVITFGEMKTVPSNGGAPVFSSAKSTVRPWSIVVVTDSATWCKSDAVTVTTPETFGKL